MMDEVSLVAHADWSVNPKKCWCAFAIRESDGQYRVYAPKQVIDPSSLLQEFQGVAGLTSCILVGFDFPIGLPYRYAEKAGISDFLAWLPGLGQGEWSDFYQVAETRDQISLHRPFFPWKPGGTSRQVLTGRLDLDTFDDLLRECERAHPARRAACPLFWTLGGQQVGKAALFGWKEVLIPALLAQAGQQQDAGSADSAFRKVAIWPFSGALETLLQSGSTVIVETYPAEFYTRLSVKFTHSQTGQKSGKRVQADRAANAYHLLSGAAETGLALDPALEREIQNGFGSSADGEDRFDAVVGLFGMLDVIHRSDEFVEPRGEQVRAIEGWIFGQDPGLAATA